MIIFILFFLKAQGEPSGFSCLTNDVSDDSLSNGRHQILGKNNGKQPLNEWDEEHYRFQGLISVLTLFVIKFLAPFIF